MQTINERIVAIRYYKSLKQKEFSEILKIPRSSISEIESGKRSPNVDLIVGISTHFKDINLDWLLTGEGDMRREAKNDWLIGQDKAAFDYYLALRPEQRREILAVIQEKKRVNELESRLDQLQMKVG